MAIDKKASELAPVADPAAASWAAYAEVGGIKVDGRLSVADIRPGVSALGVRVALDSNLQAVADAIPAAVTDPVTLRWQCGARVQVDDPLYAHIQATLGWTTPQMTTLMAAAADYE